MTATGHAIIGTLIAAKFSNPFIGIPLAFISHTAADAFPHWDTATNYRKKSRTRLFVDTAIDVVVGFVLSYLIIVQFFPQTNLTYAFSLIIVAQLLDWATVPYFFFNMHYAPFSWVYKFQKIFDNRLDKPWGIINQAGILIIALLATKYL